VKDGRWGMGALSRTLDGDGNLDLYWPTLDYPLDICRSRRFMQLPRLSGFRGRRGLPDSAMRSTSVMARAVFATSPPAEIDPKNGMGWECSYPIR